MHQHWCPVCEDFWMCDENYHAWTKITDLICPDCEEENADTLKAL